MTIKIVSISNCKVTRKFNFHGRDDRVSSASSLTVELSKKFGLLHEHFLDGRTVTAV